MFAGDSFSVDLEKGESSVKSLKSSIQDKEGISIFSQTLFKLAKSGKAEDASEFPLADDVIIEESLSVALCISVLAQWDSKSPLITQSKPYYKLSGDGSTATRTEEGSYKNTLFVAGPAMAPNSGKFVISFNIKEVYANVGVVKEGHSCLEDAYTPASVMAGWGIWTGFTGMMHDVGKECYTCPGKMLRELGSILTLEMDTDVGSLKMWLDGKSWGPGYGSGVITGAVRWGIILARKYIRHLIFGC